VLVPADLELDAVAIAAAVIAEEYDYDESVVERAVRYARAEEGTAQSRFRALLVDLVAEPDRRDLVYDRLRDHVHRRRREETDVDGLFESE
jgi:hypothetical protein